MSLSKILRATLLCSCMAAISPVSLRAQTSYGTNGGEYGIAGSWLGDQVRPAIALTPTGGYLAWEDNITDGAGLGIGYIRLDSGFSARSLPQKVNSTITDDQEHVQVTALKDGGAAFVWQGGKLGFQHIYARFLSAGNTWLSSDFQVNASQTAYQINPVLATLANGNVVVLYSSFNQVSSNSMQDVYGQMLSPTGEKIGGEFLVNQFTTYNQRTPVVAALSGGGFVVVWVSEQQRQVGVSVGHIVQADQLVHPSVDIYARLFKADATALGDAFLVNTSADVCANPSVAASLNGGFMVAWGQKHGQVREFGWDVFARGFSNTGAGGAVSPVNTQTFGDQFAPRIAAAGDDYMLVWTSMGQDGSMEGVYGRVLKADGSPNGAEFRANTTWISRQMHPTVASDGSRFLVTWTSFVGSPASFDLFAQRYVNINQALEAMPAPFVYVPFVVSNGVYQPQIVICWPAQSGLPVASYGLYIDGSPTPSVSLETNVWVMTAANGLSASSTHTFRVDYVTTDNRRTPLSPTATATTWNGYSWGGIPFEWMSELYGTDTSQWPSAGSRLATDGPTLYQVFLTGADPRDSSTWLRTRLASEVQKGQTYYRLSWNSQPGLNYQVQMSSDMRTWTDFGSARFASDTSDSVIVPVNQLNYYRIVRLR